MQMEWDGIPIRRSSRLYLEPGPSTAPPTPPSSGDDVPDPPRYHEHELPDLGHGVKTIALPDIEVDFNVDYFTSQETGGYYSSSEDLIDNPESNRKNERGGGLEDLLWPPKVLMQARNYGKSTRMRRITGHLQTKVRIEAPGQRADGEAESSQQRRRTSSYGREEGGGGRPLGFSALAHASEADWPASDAEMPATAAELPAVDAEMPASEAEMQANETIRLSSEAPPQQV